MKNQENDDMDIDDDNKLNEPPQKKRKTMRASLSFSCSKLPPAHALIRLKTEGLFPSVNPSKKAGAFLIKLFLSAYWIS